MSNKEDTTTVLNLLPGGNNMATSDADTTMEEQSDQSSPIIAFWKTFVKKHEKDAEFCQL
jgi:hypothetical protein